MEQRIESDRLIAGPWRALVTLPRQPLALVLSVNVGRKLRELTSQRCKAALPFAGKYRLIDFALSSCVNSEMERVGVITQYQPRSLHAHLAHGRPWDLDRSGGLTVLHPYQGHTGMSWYTGTADAVYQNLDFVFHDRADEVLVLPGDQVYSIDLNVLTAQHRRSKADLTVAVVAIEESVAQWHPTAVVDHDGWIQTLLAPADDRAGPLAVMGVLLFSRDVLSWRLSEDAQRQSSTHDLVRDVLPGMIEAGDRVMAFQYTGYWEPLRTVHDYWQAHMRLLNGNPGLNLQDTAWPVRTRSEIRPPTHVSARARVLNSLLSEGCIIDGTVEYSVLSPGVQVSSGAVVRNSIVLHDTSIEERALVENAILDTGVIVGSCAQVGQVRHRSPKLGVSVPEPLTVIARDVHMPAREVIRADGWIYDQLARASVRSVSSARVEAT